MPSILVSFGPSGEDMAALRPDALLGSYAELPGVVAGLWAKAPGVGLAKVLAGI